MIGSDKKQVDEIDWFKITNQIIPYVKFNSKSQRSGDFAAMEPDFLGTRPDVIKITNQIIPYVKFKPVRDFSSMNRSRVTHSCLNVGFRWYTP